MCPMPPKSNSFRCGHALASSGSCRKRVPAQGRRCHLHGPKTVHKHWLNNNVPVDIARYRDSYNWIKERSLMSAHDAPADRRAIKAVRDRARELNTEWRASLRLFKTNAQPRHVLLLKRLAVRMEKMAAEELPAYCRMPVQ